MAQQKAKSRFPAIGDGSGIAPGDTPSRSAATR